MALAALLVASLPFEASAGPSDELTQAARKVMKEAGDAANRSEWALCRTKAVGVWDQFKRPSVASLLGSCEVELGMNREAAEHLDFFLQHDDKSNDKQTKAAEERYPKARAKVQLVVITCNQPDADIHVDGQSNGSPSPRIFLEPGHHTIEITKAGFAPHTEQVEAVGGGESKLSVTLDPANASAAGGAPPSTSSSSSPSSADTGAGGGDVVEKKPVWPYVVGGVVAAAGIGVGIGGMVTSASHSSKADDLLKDLRASGQKCANDASPACAPIQSEYDSRDTLRGVGIAGFVVGGAALVATVIYAAIPAKHHRANALQIIPLVGPTQGLVVRSSF